ncbi:MAG: monovalent cation/H(+) antiporter subunit G [Actinomycetota bacterium]|nr:monovalent cation/H(+) antiporter subunit G [Actinomycetota bacterium]MDD5666747.1 monovalent cation/H(+) antiporter subunit G [Actinomycetota bacterium]
MVQDIVAGAFCCVGTFFFLVGTTGLIRMPDVFSRLHPSTKCDTLGACSLIVGMAVYSGWSWELLKLIIIACFVLLSSATCGHAIGRSALRGDIKCWRRKNGVEDGHGT